MNKSRRQVNLAGMQERLVGRRLAAARVETGYSPDQMAEIVGKSVSSVYTYERGEATPPPRALMQWANATGKSIGWLLGEGELEDLEGAAGRRGATVAEQVHPGHPGVEALAQDMDLRREQRITDQEIEALRQLRGKWTNGQEVIILTRSDALLWLQPLRSSRPYRA